MTKFDLGGFSSPESFRDLTPALKGDPDKYRDEENRVPLPAGRL
ncbi:hypothetical protein [Sinomicrobium sp. M5D2P9]